MKPEFKSLDQLFNAARSAGSPSTPGDEAAPFGFAQRVVARWKAVGQRETFYWEFKRLAGLAAICSWAIACTALFCAWQSGFVPWNHGSDWNDAFYDYCTSMERGDL